MPAMHEVTVYAIQHRGLEYIFVNDILLSKTFKVTNKYSIKFVLVKRSLVYRHGLSTLEYIAQIVTPTSGNLTTSSPLGAIQFSHPLVWFTQKYKKCIYLGRFLPPLEAQSYHDKTDAKQPSPIYPSLSPQVYNTVYLLPALLLRSKRQKGAILATRKSRSSGPNR